MKPVDDCNPGGPGLTRRTFVAGSGMLLVGATQAGSQEASGHAPPASAGTPDPKLIQDLVVANRILAHDGVVDGYGHVSVRHNVNPERYLLSRSLAPELVSAEDIMEFDLDSVPVDPRGRAMYVERFIHGQIYQTRPDVKAIVHNHSPSLIPFGTTGWNLKPLYHMSSFIGEGVPVFDIRKSSGMTDMLVRDADRARALSSVLGNKPAVLMRGHGAVVVGPSLPVVVGRSVYLEINARLQAQAIALADAQGAEVEYLSPQEAQQATPPDNYQRAWDLWARKALSQQK